jgi:hypothetical protein
MQGRKESIYGTAFAEMDGAEMIFHKPFNVKGLGESG